MELDLDSILNRHSTTGATATTDSDSDEDVDPSARRTVDDILNESDTSSSSLSPPLHAGSRPSLSPKKRDHSNSRSDSGADDDDFGSVYSSLTTSTDRIRTPGLGVGSGARNLNKPESPHVDKNYNSGRSRYNLLQRYKSDEFSAFSNRRPPVPSLFGGGVRSSAKPGAALAAAAAASRSIPTPHAAAIKSRRAMSVSLESSVSVGDEMLGFDRVSVSSPQDEARLDEVDDQMGGFRNPSISREASLGLNIELPKKDVTEPIPSGAIESSEDFNKLGSDKLGTDESEKMPLGQELALSTSIAIAETSSDHPHEGDQNLEENMASSSSHNIHHEQIVSMSYPDWDLVEFEEAKPSVTENSVRDGGFPPDLGKETPEMHDVVNESAGAKTEEVESISDDITRLVEDRLAQLESERSIKMTDEKLHSFKKPLEVAEELEKKQASTGLHLEEGAAAQPMRLEGVRRGSTVLGYFDVNAGNSVTRTVSSLDFRRDHGSPEVLAVHHNYIAVGTSKGVVLVLPSKYSVYNNDNMDSKISFLGLDGDKSQASVTSLCFNLQGDMLLAGYGDGHITLWDLQRETAARVVSGEHKAPVVHSFFLGQKAVSGDCKGLLLLHTISVMPLLGRLKVETQCLLDGQRTGTVLCASPLIPDVLAGAASLNHQGSSTSSASSFGGYSAWKLFSEGTSLSEEGVVVFITYQTALVVRLTPSLEVYSQLSRPEGVREGSMPYAAWKCTTQTQGSPAETIPVEASEKISWLAIAWDRKVQIAKLVKSDLKVCGKWTLDSAAIGLTWLDDQMLVILTLTGQLCLYTRDGKLIHQTSYTADRFGGEDLIAYHTHFSNSFGNPEKSYHNCVALRGASIYILGPAHLVVSRLLPWKERIQVLRKAGDWMGALNMAMTLYDGEAHGVIDLPRSLDSVQVAVMPYLMELLFAYVDEVFSYISVACNNQVEKSEDLERSVSMNNSKLSEIKEQFTRVGGVAVEFCVHIKRTDILFEDIFSKFVRVHQKDTFLELLEPYILKDMLGSLPPEIMQALVEHYNCKGWLQRVEQCVLHMDISSLDFNQVVRLCREHGLYGAFIYLFNKGLDDFRTPLEELVAVLRDSENEVASALGYRMLVYLKYCFTGLAFPPGHGTLPSTRIPSLRAELVQFLLQDSGGQKSKPIASLVSTGSHINLYYLLELDTEATLEVLKHAFVEYQKLEDSVEGSSDSPIVPPKVSEVTDNSHLLQKTVDSLVHILHIDISRAVRSAGNDDNGPGVWPSRKDIGYVIEFIASFVACKSAFVSKSVLSQILEYLISENDVSPKEPIVRNESAKRREKQVLALLDAVPDTDWSDSYVLHLCENAEFYQVCGLIHSIRQRHLAALDSYLKDVDEPVYAFSFINNTLLHLRDTNLSAFRSEVISRIPELTILSRECTLLLIIDHLNEERGQILSKLHPHPRSLFLYLKTVVEVHVSGTLNFSRFINDKTVEHGGSGIRYQQNGLATYLERVSGFPKLLRDNPIEVSEEMIELYFELLCQFEPDSVLKFLETYESYRVELCLRFCQQYGVVDGAVFLLERVGDVGTALQLTLSGINSKFMMLHAAVETIVSDVAATNISNMECLKESLGLKETQDINKILCACIALCQRNTLRLDPDESETLWFELLDTFCKPLVLNEEHSKVELINKDNIGTDGMTWKIPKARKSTPILKRLFAQFIKEVVEGMIRYVRLPSIMSKLLADNGSQEFGDFKITILGMLGTYGFERRILDTAKSLIEDDTFYTLSLLKKGSSHGYAPRSALCCMCNCPFNKSSSVRVFSCGHATHEQCEHSEAITTSSTQGFSSGCPVCAPKKRIQNSTSKMVQHGQVNRASSRSQQGQGTSSHLAYETDGLDNNRGMHQFSRFEILNKLQKSQRLVQLENVPQLRLAPPAVYHEKVVKGAHLTAGSSSSSSSLKPSKNKQLSEIRAKTPSIRFPLRSKIFGKEKSVVA